MGVLSLFTIFWYLASATFFDARDSHFDHDSYLSSDVITREVAVLGGGATGIYAAINLQLQGKSVVVVKREAVLDGHTNTYTDPATHEAVDYGVVAFWNISVTREYFANLGIPIIDYPHDPTTTLYADFQTGVQVAGVSAHATNNFTDYEAQLDKYPYLQYSWDLPDPVPSDLLLPFGQFLAKYNLGEIAYNIFADGEGAANLLNQLTVNVFKLIGKSYISGDIVIPASHNNSDIYGAALARLGSDALLSSTVVWAKRPGNGTAGVSLVVQTPTGQKLIQASKLLISIPPLIDNSKRSPVPYPSFKPTSLTFSPQVAPLDLDSIESSLFSQWSYSNYFVLLLNNTGLPPNYHFANANASTATYDIPELPAPYQVTSTRVPGLFYVWYGSPVDLTRQQVESDTLAVMRRLQQQATNLTEPYPTPNVLRFNSHTPFKLVVSADAIRDGFYEKLEGRKFVSLRLHCFVHHLFLFPTLLLASPNRPR